MTTSEIGMNQGTQLTWGDRLHSTFQPVNYFKYTVVVPFYSNNTVGRVAAVTSMIFATTIAHTFRLLANTTIFLAINPTFTLIRGICNTIGLRPTAEQNIEEPLVSMPPIQDHHLNHLRDLLTHASSAPSAEERRANLTIFVETIDSHPELIDAATELGLFEIRDALAADDFEAPAPMQSEIDLPPLLSDGAISEELVLFQENVNLFNAPSEPLPMSQRQQHGVFVVMTVAAAVLLQENQQNEAISPPPGFSQENTPRSSRASTPPPPLELVPLDDEVAMLPQLNSGIISPAVSEQSDLRSPIEFTEESKDPVQSDFSECTHNEFLRFVQKRGQQLDASEEASETSPAAAVSTFSLRHSPNADLAVPVARVSPVVVAEPKGNSPEKSPSPSAAAVEESKSPSTGTSVSSIVDDDDELRASEALPSLELRHLRSAPSEETSAQDLRLADLAAQRYVKEQAPPVPTARVLTPTPKRNVFVNGPGQRPTSR
ncbi:MAG TPA: hypothetical protein VJK48_02400 [Chlamydiales bacterium]|nr:hypothetical protein [Chlamydiales bacterium]